MPSWNDLLDELESQEDDAAKIRWLESRQRMALQEVGRLRGGRNVLSYASAFLQKPYVPSPWIILTHEEINGFMSTIYKMDFDRGLTLLLHTPGGVTNAAETIVAYLRSKFSDLEVIVPTYAMSAGTMISLAADRIVLGRQSQLGPIDPQLPLSDDRFVSARAVVDQFAMAKLEILRNRDAALAWAPVLQSIGPALLQEALFALEYGEQMVGRWLAKYMFGRVRGGARKAKRVAKHFNDAAKHKSHGRRIDREEAKHQGLTVEELEANQGLQEAVLTTYHVQTLAFEKTLATKALTSSTGRHWIKSWAPQASS
jgi:hypothetical protein